MKVCILIEAEFCNNIEKIPDMSKLRSRLVTLTLSKLQGKVECDYCKTLQFVVHLYSNIGLHHVLRVNSRVFNCFKGKKNRILLKLRQC